MATLMAAPVQTRDSFSELTDDRRSSAVSTNNSDSSNPEDYYEDWSKTTSEKQSWAYRERRRNSKFSTFDNDMARQASEKEARRRSARQGASVLGIFQEGVDKAGNKIVLSDDHHDDIEVNDSLLEPPRSPVPPPYDDRRLSMSTVNSDKRKGSILSLWKTGKDKAGNEILRSGFEDNELEPAISLTDSQPESVSSLSIPSVEERDDRRGSILSIWRQGKDSKGNAIILSGHALDEEVIEEDGEPLEQVISATSTSSKGKGPSKTERQGSILSIWSQGKDKEGNSLILSGGELDESTEPISDEAVEAPKVKSPRSQARKGSILSMWAEGKERDGTDRPGKVKLEVHDEYDDEYKD